MGINNFYKLIEETGIPLSKLKSIHHVLVDISIYAHKWGHLKSKFNGACAYGFAHHMAFWLSRGITPHYIFDGKPPAIKNCVGRPQRPICDRASLQQYARTADVQYTEAGGEAEALCAVIAKTNKNTIVDSTDSDTLIFGTPYLYKAGKVFSLDKILKHLNIGRPQLVCLAILLGNCYNPPVLPPSKALAHIHNMKTPNKILSIVPFDKKKTLDIYKYYMNPMGKFKPLYRLKYNIPIYTPRSPLFALMHKEGMTQEQIKKLKAKLIT